MSICMPGSIIDQFDIPMSTKDIVLRYQCTQLFFNMHIAHVEKSKFQAAVESLHVNKI